MVNCAADSDPDLSITIWYWSEHHNLILIWASQSDTDLSITIWATLHHSLLPLFSIQRSSPAGCCSIEYTSQIWLSLATARYGTYIDAQSYRWKVSFESSCICRRLSHIGERSHWSSPNSFFVVANDCPKSSRSSIIVALNRLVLVPCTAKRDPQFWPEVHADFRLKTTNGVENAPETCALFAYKFF
jgi:hypothetical protein